jgi:DNA-binding PadR family transcriptional regulator
MDSFRLGVLALLDVTDMDGDGLATALDEWAGGNWTVDRIAVGETLDQLVSEGLVAVVAGRDAATPTVHTTYTVTGAGREALVAWFAADPIEGPPPRDELLAKVLWALPSGRERALRVITGQRSSLTAELQRRRRAAHPPTARSAELKALPPVLVADAHFAQVEAELRWLDLCEARLDGTGRNGGRT